MNFVLSKSTQSFSFSPLKAPIKISLNTSLMLTWKHAYQPTHSNSPNMYIFDRYFLVSDCIIYFKKTRKQLVRINNLYHIFRNYWNSSVHLFRRALYIYYAFIMLVKPPYEWESFFFITITFISVILHYNYLLKKYHRYYYISLPSSPLLLLLLWRLYY